MVARLSGGRKRRVWGAGHARSSDHISPRGCDALDDDIDADARDIAAAHRARASEQSASHPGLLDLLGADALEPPAPPAPPARDDEVDEVVAEAAAILRELGVDVPLARLVAGRRRVSTSQALVDWALDGENAYTPIAPPS